MKKKETTHRPPVYHYMSREEMDAFYFADLVFGLCNGHEILFYGRKFLEAVVSGEEEEVMARVFYFELNLDLASDDLEQWVVACELVKGHCDYEPHPLAHYLPGNN